MKLIGTGLAIAALCMAAPVVAAPAAAVSNAAKRYVTKRDAFGRPSLEGMWSANFLMTLEADKDAAPISVPEAEAKALFAARAKKTAAFFDRALDPEVPALLPSVDGLPIVRGQRRTRLITVPADGKLPLTPAGRKEMEADGPPESFDNPEYRPNSERCTVGNGQPPFVFLTFGDQLQILQTRDTVVLHSEYGDMMRVIPLTDRRGPAVFESKAGDSIARWEGDTLVIETVRLPDKDRSRFFPSFIVSSEATVIERLTRVSHSELLYQFSVVDPKVYSAPWQGEFSWYATEKPMYEHACHEGNYSLPGILAGARREEAVAAAKAVVIRAAFARDGLGKGATPRR